MYKDIIKRADKERGIFAHIGFRAICKRCGLHANIDGYEIKKKYGDAYTDIRDKNDIECRSPRCTGKMKILYKIAPERMIHLWDIRHRT